MGSSGDGMNEPKTNSATNGAKASLNNESGNNGSRSPNSANSSSSIPSSGSRSSPGKTLTRWLFWSFAFVITTTVSASVGATLALLTPLSPIIAPWENDRPAKNDLWSSILQYRVSRPVNILVMGVDRVLNVPDNSPEIFAGRSDTILLLRVDPTDNSVSLLSIPRDTQVDIPGIGVTKINDANPTGGPSLAARTVSRTLNNVPIDRYVRVSTQAFRELVDLLGGVDIFVPYPMSYVDQTQKLKINLAQGWQTLNGDQAEQFARFRKDSLGDIGRVQRQQALLKALRERLTSPTVLPKLPQIVRVMQKYVDTNLSLEEMLALVNSGLKLDQDRFKQVLLPGRFSTQDEYVASYWIMNSLGRDRIMRDYFKLGSTYATANETINDYPPLKDLKIAIQNASGQPELSRQVEQYLVSQGFRNLYLLDDWTDQQRQTQIIAQQGDLVGAAALKKVLGVGAIDAASIGDIESDITIRVGKDWQRPLTQPIQ